MTTPWTDEMFEDDTSEPGLHRHSFATAVQCWSIMQQREETSVAEAARVFNTSPTIVKQAVEGHMYMFLTGPHDDYERLLIGHDGE